MREIIVNVLLSSLACTAGFTQTWELVDSLHQQVASAQDDASRINTV